MKKALVCLFALMLLSGCVSTQTYKAKVDESEALKARLAEASKGLADEKEASARLKKDLESRENDAAALNAALGELKSKGVMTSREIDDLRKERDRLAAAERSKAEEIASLRKSLDESAARVGALEREVDGLKKENGRLAMERDAKSGESAAQKEELQNQARDREYLQREVERLKVKAGELSSEKEKEIANVKNAYENLVKEMKQEIEKGDIKITQAVDRLSVNMVEKILFDSGKAEIKPEGLKVIKRVGDILKKVSDRQIRVEGHTDNVQIGARIRDRYPTNWELSTARATNVVRYLQDKVGIDHRLLSAAGFAENKPVASNETQEGKAQNRRIEIVLLPLDVDRVLEELKK